MTLTGMTIMNDRHPQWCRVGNNLSWKILLCILYLSLGAAVAIVNVTFDGTTVSKVIACAGTSTAVRVNWGNGNGHNIQETETAACDSKEIGPQVEEYRDAGYIETFTGTTLSALPGQTRYYKCSYHCGQASRFEVSCPAEADTVAVNYDAATVSKVIACAGTAVRVNWGFYHNIVETETAACNSGDIKTLHGNEDAPHTQTFTTLSAPSGETRYFKCLYHCGQAASRFEVSCPASSCTNTEYTIIHKNKEKTCARLLNKFVLPPKNGAGLLRECNKEYPTTDPSTDTVLVSDACPTFCKSKTCCAVDENIELVVNGKTKRCGGLLNSLKGTALTAQCDAVVTVLNENGRTARVRDVCTGLCDPSCPKEVNCKNKNKNEFLLTKNKKTCNQRFKKITNKNKRKQRCKQKTKIYSVKNKKFVKNKTLKQICPLYCDNKCY